MDEHEIQASKISFWWLWTIANALSLAAGWPLGETLGQFVAKNYGWHAGLLTASLVFEITVWFWRLLVIRRFREFDVLRVIDGIVWITTELFTWFMIEAFSTPGAPLTFGVSLMFPIGAGVWIAMAATRLAGRKSSAPGLWWITAFALTLFGFLAGSILISLITVFAMEVDTLVQSISPPLAWGMAGTVMGCSIGALTGLALIKMMRWPRPTGLQSIA